MNKKYIAKTVMKYLNCRVCEMTLNAAAELEKGVFFGWCSKCQTTTEVQAAPEPTPITQVDPAWQKAMDDLMDEKELQAFAEAFHSHREFIGERR